MDPDQEPTTGRPPEDEGAHTPGDRPSRPTPTDREGRGADAAGGSTEVTEPQRTPMTQQLGRVTVVVLAVLFGVFALANSQHVDFSWLFGGTEVVADVDGERLRGGVPLIVLLLAAFVIGLVVGAFTTWQAGRARRARERKGERKGGRKG